MKKKILIFVIIILLISTCFSTISFTEELPLNTLSPTVEITYPTDGAEITEQYIVVEGNAYDEMGLNYYQWTWEWSEGSQSGDQEIDPPVEYYDFQIDIGPLVVGENTVTVTFFNTEGGSGSDSVTFFYVTDDNDPPEVVITYPEEDDEFDEPEITVLGYADDHGGSGITKLFWIHKWEDGQDSDAEYYDIPLNYITYSIPVILKLGENVITVNAMDLAGNFLLDPPSITVFYTVSGDEGLLIDSVFQPVQTVYPHDPIYGNDIRGGPCGWTCDLDMIAGKNTFLFGYPYSEREKIKITAHNNYKTVKTFSFVFMIHPDGKVIWRSDLVTLEAGEKKTFIYDAPIPEKPFQWDIWGDSDKSKIGSVDLFIDPKYTKPPADCNCIRVEEYMLIRKTHDLKVLFVPWRFIDGPHFPPDLKTPRKVTDFDNWRWNTLEPWWNAIYPIRENGVDTDYGSNLQGGIVMKLSDGSTRLIECLWDLQTLKPRDRKLFILHCFKWGAKGCLTTGYDRVVFLVHPDILEAVVGRKVLGCASFSGHRSNYKYGVLVDWNNREDTAVHEVSHTYGLHDNYIYDKITNKITYIGDNAPGYWVNRKWDVPVSAYDLMAAVNDLMDAYKVKTWIKKPNFKFLYWRFSHYRDPEVLGISGFIDKNETVELHPWYKMDEGYIDLEWNTTGDYLVKVYDDNNILLGEAGFNVSFVMSVDDIGDIEFNQTIFAFRVEWINGMHWVDIVNTTSNEILATRTATLNIPQISIISPSPGETLKPEFCEITWDSNDLDGDDLTYSIYIRNESEVMWFPINLECTDNSWTANFTTLPKDGYQIKVLATDGWNTAEDIVDFQIKKGKAINTNSFFLQFLENHPHLFPHIRIHS